MDNLHLYVKQRVIDIVHINPFRNPLAVKGRVSSKTPINQWCNEKGSGNLFSFGIQDNTGEIRITAFTAECDKFFDMVEVGKVFIIWKAVIKRTTNFYRLHPEYELNFSAETVVIPGDDDDSNCPKMSFDFVKIKNIAATNADTLIDVFGVCTSVGELVTSRKRNTGSELKKRDISLVDYTTTEINLTLWGNDAEHQIINEGSTVVVKNARVFDFNGKWLKTTQVSFVQIDPTMPEAVALRSWYNALRVALHPTLLSDQWKKLCEINLAAVRNERGALTFSTVAKVTEVGRLTIYLACPEAGCKKKVKDMNNGFYKCYKCNKDFMHYDLRIVLNLEISDGRGQLWITVFHENVERILGITAIQLMQMKDANSAKCDEIISLLLNFKRFRFRLRSVEDHYMGGVKTTVLAITDMPST